MNNLALKTVRSIVDAALDGPRENPSDLLAVAVVDAAGNLLDVTREQGAPVAHRDIAEAKAKGSVVIGMPTRAIKELAKIKPTWFDGASRVAQSRTSLPLCTSLGGVIIRDEKGGIIGAVGVSGGTQLENERRAKYAIEHVSLYADVDGLKVTW